MTFLRPLIVLSLFATGCAPGPIGKPAPDFALTTVDGHHAQLSSQKGKVVLLDFWATWCPNCPGSLAHAQQLSSDKDRAARGLVVWTIDGADAPADIRAYLQKRNWNFPVVLDPETQAINGFSASQLPVCYIIGRDGKIKEAYLGFGPTTGAKVDAAIDQALGEIAR